MAGGIAELGFERWLATSRQSFAVWQSLIPSCRLLLLACGRWACGAGLREMFSTCLLLLAYGRLNRAAGFQEMSSHKQAVLCCQEGPQTHVERTAERGLQALSWIQEEELSPQPKCCLPLTGLSLALPPRSAVQPGFALILKPACLQLVRWRLCSCSKLLASGHGSCWPLATAAEPGDLIGRGLLPCRGQQACCQIGGQGKTAEMHLMLGMQASYQPHTQPGGRCKRQQRCASAQHHRGAPDGPDRLNTCVSL